ncbi:phosphotransferase family protein [Sphingomonas sp. BIUV-7]|uniref:Phosphotransferase family protein n=1 Tax=Sphingomonas natans TaxID=3063330 RepID=A0ABT8Y943_9SPHN|nr:phosphotransferase family protein [Sphingomonas sp. BIUV-7]MDO6414492.1 phosphotransferase family protein [Sphingomonas sp. BIUV-7]
MSELERRLADYLAHQQPGARNLSVTNLARIQGGSSQETYRFRATWEEEGRAVERNLILRRAPPAGLVVAERDIEFTVYRALAGHGVPVPGAYHFETEPCWLDRPFFIMDLMPGKPGHFYASADPYDGQSDAVARAFWRHLGTLAALDHRVLGLAKIRNGKADDDLWSRELDWWTAILEKGEDVPEPIVHAAIRWLRRHPPPGPVKPAIVHGDYRAGNFLFTPDGRISAILDWEMCHVGDPLEDVAWAIDPFWPMTRHLALEEGLREWEASSGLVVDRLALDWWRLFSAVKACAIWTTAEASFTHGEAREMVVAMSGIRAGHFHRNLILTLMTERGIAA